MEPSGDTSPQTVDVDPAGNVYVADSGHLEGATTRETWLSKYSSEGQLVWSFDLEPRLLLSARHIVAAQDGVYVAGDFQATVNLDPDGGTGGLPESEGSADGYLAKYDSNGDFQWAQRWGGTGGDSLYGVGVPTQGYAKARQAHLGSSLGFDSGVASRLKKTTRGCFKKPPFLRPHCWTVRMGLGMFQL